MEYDEEDNFYFDENLFKIISITPTKRIEKKKNIGLYVANN